MLSFKFYLYVPLPLSKVNVSMGPTLGCRPGLMSWDPEPRVGYHLSQPRHTGRACRREADTELLLAEEGLLIVSSDLGLRRTGPQTHGISNSLEQISSLSHSVVFVYFFALIPVEGFLISCC